MQRMTEQRRVILDEIRRMRTHPTADQVYDAVRARLPRVSLGTVYRNLDTMSRCGVIRKLAMVEGQARFDGDTEGHLHVRCTVCGHIADVHQTAAELPWETVAEETGFEVTGQRLEFEGICPACRGLET